MKVLSSFIVKAFLYNYCFSHVKMKCLVTSSLSTNSTTLLFIKESTKLVDGFIPEKKMNILTTIYLFL